MNNYCLSEVGYIHLVDVPSNPIVGFGMYKF